MSYFYNLYNLNIKSEIELSGINHGSENYDVFISRGDLPDDLGQDSIIKPSFSYLNNIYLLNIKDTIKIKVEDGNKITVDAKPEISNTTIKSFILSQGMGVLLHQRGVFTIHSNAVEIDGKAVLLCGKSGAGKSTISAELINRGYKFINDDISVLQNIDGKFYINPGIRQLKLWKESLQFISHNEQNLEQIRPELEKFRIEIDNLSSNELIELNRIYILSINELNPYQLFKPDSIQKLKILRNQVYIKNIANFVGNKVKNFENLTTLSKTVEVRTISRPRQSAPPSIIVDMILEDMLT